ncbi:ATPase, T2SS/T4P/T4SS family [Lacticaseibacillus parahuelsenbergensis]|uniref:ATPase, T2SS/T4P/T4SS family n=1 Tax=Lacticaseibacillus parahuelsenbergensis TaxID=3068305 RepID=A0ABY9L598_9LACO|nr:MULTISPECIES: ATPase, T2SS/T4P/T4SS family [Lacticaseibacillus]MDE3281999.1 Flp pilus assembly complex ATPase component TadA [Lacticaseibacillus casei]WLV78912.1 ATPase, T2SS/T4P/T4SS family [Lacticaseibacillus sp. NCIMB 15471]
MQSVNELLTSALAKGASDIYYLPSAQGYLVRLRLPTGLMTLAKREVRLGQQEINYLKFMAGMNVAEHRRVQLGAFYQEAPSVFLRLSSVADYRGRESLVVRLISGIPDADGARQLLDRLMSILLQRRGMLTLAGPTGSGKTTLLYQLATRLAESRMVLSIEDPVEINQPQFLQLQVNPEAEMSYPQLLKAALRHRPDVLLIGEIRDRQTAQSACEAAISGHIVLATVHARSAGDTPLRLTSFGLSEELVAAALTASAAIALRYRPVIHPVAELVVFERSSQSQAQEVVS